MNNRENMINIALVGQPNTGKSTVFNQLTGSHQHVGNWPGKTVEKKAGVYSFKETEYHVVDLPGTYSLSANSSEEIITRNFVLDNNPDAVIVMVDASQIDRIMYLLAEMVTLPSPIVLALNMIDVAEQEGRKIDVHTLQQNLGIPVIPMVASKNKGILELKEAINKITTEKNKQEKSQPTYNDKENELLLTLEKAVAKNVPDSYPPEWVAVKLIEGDKEVISLIRNSLSGEDWHSLEEKILITKEGSLKIASARYEWIRNMLENSISRSAAAKLDFRRGTFDRIATHPVWGVLLSIGIFILSFALAMVIALPIMQLSMGGLPMLIEFVQNSLINSPSWFTSMLADGLLPGVGMALAFLGFMFGVFLVIGFVEDIGYMARVAFVADRFMSRIGLQGKSFMPMFSSFGCNIAGVLGSRVVDSYEQRMMTLIMAPIIPCLAVWGVTGFFGTLFFGNFASIITIILFISLFIWLAITGNIFKKILIKDHKPSGLIMELPPYHKPNWKTIWRFTWMHTKSFLVRGFTLIAGASLVIWMLSYLPNGEIDSSYLSQIGRFLEPVGMLMGLDWKLMVALVASVASKEASIATLGVIYGLPAGVSGNSLTGLILGAEAIEQTAVAGLLQSSISPASALAFIFAVFFSIPCLGTMGAIYSETKSWKWTLGAAGYYTFASLLAGFLAYRTGLLIF